MNKRLLLKSIADTAYNVGFGAKKHWATYDIVSKVPGLIGFGSAAIGVFALVVDSLSEKTVSACLVVAGMVALYISFYESSKQNYEDKANALTILFNRLRDLYRTVQSTDSDDLTVYEEQLKSLEKLYYENCISKQILFADWLAHYKFFWQHQIDWLDEQKEFKLLRDKLPLSFMVAIVILIAIVIPFFNEKLRFWC